MASARSTAGFVAPVVGLILIAWLVQLAGLYFVHRSCKERPSFSPWWAATTTAQLPGGASCAKVFRYEWLSVWFELPILVGVVGSLAGLLGAGVNVLQRFRPAWIGILAISTSLQMWSANVMLNLTDTPISNAESSKEVLRAKVSFYGFAALSALNIILMFIIGDNESGGSADGYEEI